MKEEEITQFTPSRLEDFFKSNNLKFKKYYDGIWKLDIASKEVTFPIFIRLTSDWVTIAILDFTYISEDNNNESAELHEKLLKLNNEIFMAKFVLLQDNSISLTIDLPIEQLPFETFLESIKLLIYYGKKYWVDFPHEKPQSET